MKMDRVLRREKELYDDLGIDVSTVTVAIRADREVPTGLVLELMKIGKEAGFETFVMKATQKIDY